MHEFLFLWPVHACHPKTDRSNRAGSFQVLDDLIENLLDFQLTVHDEIGPPAPRLGRDIALAVGQKTDGLGAAGVDSYDITRGHCWKP